MRLVTPFSDVYMIIGNNSYCVEITFEEDHFCWRDRGPNKEVELLLLLSLDILNMGHTLVQLDMFCRLRQCRQILPKLILSAILLR